MKKYRAALLLTAGIAIVFVSMFINGCDKNLSLNSNITEYEKNSDLAAKLDEFMTAYNLNSSYKYSGTILAAKDDEILLKKGYGMANYEKKISNQPDNVFAIGSITKSFTAVAILQLQEKGLLNVDDPVSKYIDGNTRGNDITIHHLLTHTSGYPRDGIISKKRHVSVDENVESIGKHSLLFEPGDDFSYSNAGYTILAAIIEKVSGKSYNNYIKENILSPLYMDKSRGGIDSSYADNQSIGYKITTNPPVRSSIYDLSCVTGSGNLYSTVDDLYKYDRALYSSKLLTEESIGKIFFPYWGDWNDGYGYGWQITEMFGHKKFYHGGTINEGGYVSLMIRYPEDEAVLIFLTNNTDNTALNAVSGTMEAIIFGKEYVIPEKAKNIQIAAEVLKQYAGMYDFGNGVQLSVNYKNGKLYSTADDGNLYELLPLSDKSFYYDDHQWIRGEFIINKDNNDVTLKIMNANRVFEGKKIKE